jgi:hypothetical protein
MASLNRLRFRSHSAEQIFTSDVFRATEPRSLRFYSHVAIPAQKQPEAEMALSKTENRVFGDRCLPFLVKSVATSFGLDFHVSPRQMSVAPTVGLHITAHRQAGAKLSYPINMFVYWPAPGIRQFLSNIDRPIVAASVSERVPQEIRKVMERSGIDFTSRSQERGEVVMVELSDSVL